MFGLQITSLFVLVIVALIATPTFYRRAKLAGLHPGKAASVPFIAAGLVLACGYSASLGFIKITDAFAASAVTVNAVNFMLNVFLLLGFLALIRRNWLALVHASEIRNPPE